MDDVSVSFRIPADEDGYISFECPACVGRFKLSAGEATERDPDELYCPLCGLSADAENFHDPQVIAAAMEHMENVMADFINGMTRELEQSVQSAFVRFERGQDIPHQEVRTLRETPDLTITSFECCGTTAKVGIASALSLAYCPYCGKVRV